MVRGRIACLCVAAAVADINIATFDGAAGTTIKWIFQGDPVMGGASVGTFVVDSEKQAGILNGSVKDIPGLGAPGVIRAIGTGSIADVSSCKNIVINAMSQTDYPGFHVSIGSQANAYMPGKPFYSHGYKAPRFQVPVGEFGDVVLPLNTFTIDFNTANGDPDVSCAQNASYCPPVAVLKDMQEVTFEARAVEADVHIEVKSIRGSDCDAILV